jgi:hypothetical protein
LENIIITPKKREVLRKENVDEENIFLKEEEEAEEVKSDVMPMET